MVLSGDLTQVRISTERLTLRSFTAADAHESFVEANARIARYMSWNPAGSEDEYRLVWQGLEAAMKAGRQVSLTVRLAGTGEFIGLTALASAEGDLLETGLWIKESAQGRGYGREAVAAVLGWGSAMFHPSAFLYPVVDENTPSCRLAESLGGVVKGTRQRQKAGDSMRTLLLYHLPGAA
jgi:RimJ/RimL family protein N-acetyltransferase